MARTLFLEIMNFKLFVSQVLLSSFFRHQRFHPNYLKPCLTPQVCASPFFLAILGWTCSTYLWLRENFSLKYLQSMTRKFASQFLQISDKQARRGKRLYRIKRLCYRIFAALPNLLYLINATRVGGQCRSIRLSLDLFSTFSLTE